MSLRYILLILCILLLLLIAACRDTLPGTPPALPEGTPGVLWDITLLKESGKGFTIKKEIWKVVETDDGTFEAIDEGTVYELPERCHPEGSVNIDVSADYIEFGPGGYIVCDDIGIPPELGTLEDLIATDDCAREEPCMRPPALLITATVRYSDSGPGITYPLFNYPQTASATTENESLKFAFGTTSGTHELNWLVYGSSVGALEPISEVISVNAPPKPNSNDFITIGLDRTPPHEPNFTYWVNDSSVMGGWNMPAETEFEFFPQTKSFYFGDINNSMTPGTNLKLHSLYFDPADSCAGCN